MSIANSKKIKLNKPDIVVVGSGFFGLTIAHLFAEKLNKQVLIYEKRMHPGGNSWSEIDKTSGIEFHPYGSHIFHTSNVEIWNFINIFGSFSNYQHRVLSTFKKKHTVMPVNLMTINDVYEVNLKPAEARKLINEEILKDKFNVNKKTFEGKAILTFGRKIYNSLIKNYTLKQWNHDPKILPSTIINRIPIRFNYDNNYFTDTFQGIPLDGYSNLVLNMLNHRNIKIELNHDFFQSRNYGRIATIYTGPLDQYFDYTYGLLTWRTLDFQFERIKTVDFQGTSVINDNSIKNKFTRIHEFKHLHPERNYNSNYTLIAKEFSRFSDYGDEPYYPVNLIDDLTKVSKYRELVKREENKNIFFGGRLATYKYLDMHMAIGSAISLFNRIKNNL